MSLFFLNQLYEKQMKQKLKTSENAFCLLNWPYTFLLSLLIYWKCLFHNYHCRGQQLSKSDGKMSQKQKLGLLFSGASSSLYQPQILSHKLASLPWKMCTKEEPLSASSEIYHCGTPLTPPLLAISLQLSFSSSLTTVDNTLWIPGKVSREENLDINFQIIASVVFSFLYDEEQE